MEIKYPNNINSYNTDCQLNVAVGVVANQFLNTQLKRH